MFRRRYAPHLRHHVVGFREPASLHQRSNPAHSSPSGQKAGCDRLLTIKHSDPYTACPKITDTDPNERVAQAKRNIYNNVVPNEADLDGDFGRVKTTRSIQGICSENITKQGEMRSGVRVDDSSVCYGSTYSLRAIVHSSDAIALDLSNVDPKHQKRGAGRMLVKWGTAIKAEIGVEVTRMSIPLVKSTKTNLLYSASSRLLTRPLVCIERKDLRL